ncbi:TetR/AcrR family transcriptional regulator [Phytoactinopolyspora mesophila]|uniref:TetR family transcriptional regulator n=1 Tax=Phytoactinopolyspora mesophila TaxID=2650750 RepID=A0A7K3M5P7_9ACTN|nr:TetR/AcrR family transcriptional regulator [Phytoactinopolyspora mesophila]NDL58566.1 TetR family transcriptional regulator [Phytoactinopolyspora mesophila]
MTRHLSENDRRRQVADALLHSVAEHGLDRTTIRRVADTAGVSVGLVQRYFKTKDELLRFGIEHVYQRTIQRVDSVPIEPPVRNVVVGITEALLPLDDERERESRVWLAFVQSSLSDDAQQQTHLSAVASLVDGLHRAFEGAQRAGELAESVDAGLEARTLAAFVDGLSLNQVASKSHYDRAVIRAALHTYIDRLFRDGAP